MTTRKKPTTTARADRIRHAEAMIELWALSDLGEAGVRNLLRLNQEDRANCRDWISPKGLTKAYRQIREAYRFAVQHNARLGDGPEADEATGLEAIDLLEKFTRRIVNEALKYDKAALRPSTKRQTRPTEHDYPRLWQHVGALEPNGRSVRAATKRAAEIVLSVCDPHASKAKTARLAEDLRVRYSDRRRL